MFFGRPPLGPKTRKLHPGLDFSFIPRIVPKHSSDKVSPVGYSFVRGLCGWFLEAVADHPRMALNLIHSGFSGPDLILEIGRIET